MIHTENLHDREIMEVLSWILFSACVQMKLNLKKKKKFRSFCFPGLNVSNGLMINSNR